jgi:hypothetical protein
MDRSTSNESIDRTIPIVACGKPTPDGEMYPYKFSGRVPTSLCALYSYRKPKPDPGETGQFLTSLIERHHQGIPHRRPWRCISRKSLQKNSSTQPFLPVQMYCQNSSLQYWTFSALICRSGGACDRLAEDLVHNLVRKGLGDKLYVSKTCDWGGGKTDIKVCKRRKTLSYEIHHFSITIYVGTE